MGLSIEFYAGDPDEIGRVFTNVGFDGLRDGSVAHGYADLSLHLSPEHFDSLSEQAGAALKRTPVLLLDSLERTVGGTEGERGADVISPRWVGMMAAVPTELVATIAKNWMAVVAEDVGDPTIGSSADVEKALSDLIEVCRIAEQRSSSVVFAWYL